MTSSALLMALRLLTHGAAAPTLALAVLGTMPHTAQAQVNRCTTESGALVYTDRPCAAIGASERLPRTTSAKGVGARRAGCARNLQDLIYEITAAVDQRDVNRLGGVYHWVGMRQDSGYRVLDRLQAIVDRPLVDIVAIRGASAPVRAPTPFSNAGDTSPSPTIGAPAYTDSSGETMDANGNAAYAPPPPRRSGGPVGLRLEQTLRNSATPSRTVLGLRRHLDCWWVVLPAS
jgi:hypothetical protein